MQVHLQGAQMPNGSASDVVRDLQEFIRRDKAEFLPGFFQCQPGGYGEGDRFLGVVVPDQRHVARKWVSLPDAEIRKLLRSKWHECRLTGVFILASRFEKSEEPHSTRWFELLMESFDGINNWDLVDTAASKIVGPWLSEKNSRQKRLTDWASSGHLWTQRLAMVSTISMIRQGEFEWTIRLAKEFLGHPHDLMHKASGWMLREMGQKSESELLAFLDKHATKMPRTMLRYAIEKLPEPMRQTYLKLRPPGKPDNQRKNRPPKPKRAAHG